MMSDVFDPNAFEKVNLAFARTFTPSALSLGLVTPIEAYPVGAVPTLSDHLALAQLADQLGFASLWLRDVPFNVPSFGDPGQTFDPFVYLGFLAASTRRIALGVGSLILPLRHPAHVAKAAASVDQLSGGRLLLGVASGDRPEEFPAMAVPYHERGQRFRDCFEYVRRASEDSPSVNSSFGSFAGIDLLPKPSGTRIPMLITGGSQQPPAWGAEHADGLITYPRNAPAQGHLVSEFRRMAQEAGQPNKPVSQSLYIDLIDDENAPPSPIHLGFRSGSNHLRIYLEQLREIGVNHVALNLRFNRAPMDETLQRLASEILPHFHIHSEIS